MTTIAEARATLAAPMPSRMLRYLPTTALSIDFIAMVLVGSLAVLGRDGLGAFEPTASVAETLTIAGPLIIAGWITIIAVSGGYAKDVFGAGTDEYRLILNASLATAAVVGIACYLANFPMSRGFFLLVFVIGIPSLLVGRFSLRRMLYSARRRGTMLQRVVISGTPQHVDEIARVLRREAWLGYQVVGALIPDAATVTETTSGVPVLGRPDQVVQTVERVEADIIFFADGALGCGDTMRRVVWDLEHAAVQVVVAPSVADISRERVKVRPVGGLPLIHIEKPRALDATQWAKRTFDFAGALVLLVAFTPIFLFAALKIRLHDGGPVFFGQTRVGKDGQQFRCLKFRTMVTNAEELLAQLQAAVGFTDGLFKLETDPRVTVPGRWLRRFSLDELPQLLNVLCGHMSLVGPRPGLPSEAARYESDTERRLRVRPGMTGLWQVSGRSDLSYSEAVRLDLFYVDNWSMVQDLTILARTFGAVARSHGAY